jgi:hypothetical protein
MSSCPYKYVLGIPGQGVHALRLGGVSFNDTWMTIVGAALIAYFCNYSFLYTLIGLFVLGEVLHYLFGVQTAFLTMIGVVACPS